MASPQSQALNPYAAPKAAVADATTAEVQPVRLFSVSGRIGRVRYIGYLIGLYILFALIVGAATALAAPLGPAFVLGIFLVAAASYLVLTVMLTVQRCHDFDTTGWLSLLMLVPLANFAFWFIPGTQGRNRYGPPTPPNGIASLIVVLLIGGIFVLGIVAAIAIPAYQDYVKRAQQAGRR